MYDRASQLRLNGGYHTDRQFVLLCAQHGNKCAKCKSSNVSLTRDHIVPVSQGGNDNITNIQPLCRSCNSRKGNRHSVAYGFDIPTVRTKSDQRWLHPNAQARIDRTVSTVEALRTLRADYMRAKNTHETLTGKARKANRDLMRAISDKLAREFGAHV